MLFDNWWPKEKRLCRIYVCAVHFRLSWRYTNCKRKFELDLDCFEPDIDDVCDWHIVWYNDHCLLKRVTSLIRIDCTRGQYGKLSARENQCLPRRSRGGHWFSRGYNFPCYSLVQSIIIISYNTSEEFFLYKITVDKWTIHHFTRRNELLTG